MDFSLVLAATEAEPSTLMYVLGVLWVILKVAIGLGFVIFVHELGHFLVAKACGVKCEKFYVGFDFFELKLGPIKIPRALCKFQWGETEYGIGILPLGGYVKMLGQDDDPRNAEKEAERTKVADEDSAVAAPGEPSVTAKTSDGKTIQLDPRSYPAKSIPARMAIISAGVIMNVIFGVLMAAVAYRIGVPEMPAVIGGTAPGSPAWVANIQPGSKVIQIGKSAQPYEHLRYVDLIRGVVLNGSDRPLEMTFIAPDGQKVVHSLQPTDRIKPITDNPTIGVAMQVSRELAKRSELASVVAPESPAIEPGDKIVAINGHRIEADHEVKEHLARSPKGDLKLTVARQIKTEVDVANNLPGTSKEIEIVVPPLPVREIGAAMKIGPMVAIRKGSPAEDAGLRVGDIITAVNGEPVGDPLSLGQRLGELGTDGTPIEFSISRVNSQQKRAITKVSVVPELVFQYHDNFAYGGPTAIEAIGIAFQVTRVVESVEAGSPAEKAGIRPGDIIASVQFSPKDDESRKETIAMYNDKKAFDSIALDDDLKSWTYVHTRLQDNPTESKIKLTWSRKGQSHVGELMTRSSPDFFDESRGLLFRAQSVNHKADNWTSALALGWRETTENLKEVLQVLQRLITGRISPTRLSGPAGIIGMAGSFASEGIPMLLIFLTMLSANLAVLNFLPIPALDGGHMLFLVAEWIRGRPVDERLQIRLTIAGVLCLLGLMVFATLMDLNRFLS